jgi:YegS/Rv2252/BmrU family lipid kinase
MLCVIVNPAAGTGRAGRELASVRAALADHGLEHHVECTTGLEHARELARAAAASGELAVAFGGDGLVGAVAGALVHSEGVLGVLPGGRGNDFARGLGIPLAPRAACEVLANGVVRELDLGQVGDSTFIGIASCGFDSDANRFANQARVVRGRLVYLYSALRALVGWRPATFTVALDGEPRSFIGYTVAAASSGAYGGGMLLAPSASLEDGLLDVVLVAHVPKLRFLRLLPGVFKGAHVRLANVQVVRARELKVSADRPFTMYADGDPIAELPVVVRALPRAVRVIVPSCP